VRVLLDECLSEAPQTRTRRARDQNRARDGLGQQTKWRTARPGRGAVRRFPYGGPQSLVQQDLSSFDIAIVVLVARSDRLDDLRPLVPRVLQMLPTAKRRAVTVVGEQ
jgi:hypothetical protein